jgi:mannosylglycerate hydrolase
VRVALRAANVPAFGLQRCDVEDGAQPEGVKGDVIAVSRNTLEGTWGRVRVADGGFTFFPGARVRMTPALVSERDEGDTYTIEPVPGDRPVTGRWRPARLVWPGPLVGAVGRRFELGNRVRGTMYVRMDAGSKLLRVAVDGVNRAGNHRVRLRLPVRAGRSATADMLYGPVRRPLVRQGTARAGSEAPTPSAPMHRYVMAGGWMVCARGLNEYELTPDGSLAITLLRAVGDLSRGNLRNRPGNAGWPVATPDAQCRGPFRAELAIAYLGKDDPVRAEELADEFHAPLAGAMYRTGIDVPASVAGPELSGRGLAFRALKPREDGAGVVVRCVNVTNRPRAGFLRWSSAVTRAFRARLDETLLQELPIASDRRTIRFVAGAREVASVVVETW